MISVICNEVYNRRSREVRHAWIMKFRNLENVLETRDEILYNFDYLNFFV